MDSLESTPVGERNDFGDPVAGGRPLGIDDFDGASLVGAHADKAFFLQYLQLVLDRGWTFQTCGLADLSKRRGETTLGKMRFDGVQHLALTLGERIGIRVRFTLFGSEWDGAHGVLLSVQSPAYRETPRKSNICSMCGCAFRTYVP